MMTQICLQVIAAMLGTLAFAILFSAPQKEYLFCAITGGVGWLTYSILAKMGAGIGLSTITATFFLTVLSRYLSIARKVPITIFLVTGIFPLVPGAGIYYTAYYLMTNQMERASGMGVETFIFAGAIVLGIIFGSALPKALFRINFESGKGNKNGSNQSNQSNH